MIKKISLKETKNLLPFQKIFPLLLVTFKDNELNYKGYSFKVPTLRNQNPWMVTFSNYSTWKIL